MLFYFIYFFFLINIYILLDVLLCSIAKYFYKLCHILTHPLIRALLSYMPNCYHVCACKFLWNFLQRMHDRSEVCEAERNWHGKSGNLSNRSSGLSINTVWYLFSFLALLILYSTKCSWIITGYIWYISIAHKTVFT